MIGLRRLPGVASVADRLPRRCDHDLRRHDPRGALGRRPALHHRLRRRGGSHPHQQLRGDARSRDGLPEASSTRRKWQHERPVPGPRARHRRASARGGMFLGFGTILRKEIREWVRSRGALVVGALGVAAAVFTTRHPVCRRRNRRRGGPPLSMDPTVNVLLGWGGATVAVMALLASMSAPLRRARSRHAGLGPDTAGLPDQHPRRQVAGSCRRLLHRGHFHSAGHLEQRLDGRLRRPSGSREDRRVRRAVHHAAGVLRRPDPVPWDLPQEHRRHRRHRLPRHVRSHH